MCKFLLLCIVLCLSVHHSASQTLQAHHKTIKTIIYSKQFANKNQTFLLRLHFKYPYKMTAIVQKGEYVNKRSVLKLSGVMLVLQKTPILPNGAEDSMNTTVIWRDFSEPPIGQSNWVKLGDAYIDKSQAKVCQVLSNGRTFRIDILYLNKTIPPYSSKGVFEVDIPSSPASIERSRTHLSAPIDFYRNSIGIDAIEINKVEDKLIVSLGTSKNAVEQIWTISLNDRVWEKTFDASQNVEASAAGIKYLKAVILDEKLYLMDKQGKLAIVGSKNDGVTIMNTNELGAIIPSQLGNSWSDVPVYWDVISGAIYVTRTNNTHLFPVRVIKIPLELSSANGYRKEAKEAEFDTTEITIEFGYFGLALAMKRIGIPFFASLYVAPNTTLLSWVFQDDTLTKRVSATSRHSLPKKRGLSLIPLPQERKLNTNIALPYIAFYDKRTTFIVNVNGKVRQFHDNLFVEEQSYQPDRISPSIPRENPSIPDFPVILVLNKDTAKPSWLRFVVQDGIAHIASENNGMTSANVATTKNISNALNRAVKALGKMEWRVDDIPVQPKKQEKPEVVLQTSPPPTKTILWKELPDSKVEGVGLRVERGRTPLKRVPEGFEKPPETLVPPPPGYLYWAEYHRWDDGFGYVSHYALWKKELDTQDKSAQLEILDAVYEPIGKDKREPGTFAVAYVQGKVLFADVTYPGKDGNRVEMPLQNATLQTNISKEEIKSAVFTGNINEGNLVLKVEHAAGGSKQWKLTQVNGKETWVNIDAGKTQETIPE